jgi:mannose-6-phosphate isomerase-like protein (cupin superfamily)
MRIWIAMVFASFSVAAFAQSPDRAEVFSSAQLKSQLIELAEQAKTKGSSGAKLGDYGSHSIMLSERTAKGGAEVHAHFDDVMLVIEGKATLITGGELIDAHAGLNGESGGSGIRNGTTQSVAAGDLIHIPAGTPHQLLIAPGTQYSALVIKVKE